MLFLEGMQGLFRPVAFDTAEQLEAALADVVASRKESLEFCVCTWADPKGAQKVLTRFLSTTTRFRELLVWRCSSPGIWDHVLQAKSVVMPETVHLASERLSSETRRAIAERAVNVVLMNTQLHDFSFLRMTTTLRSLHIACEGNVQDVGALCDFLSRPDCTLKVLIIDSTSLGRAAFEEIAEPAVQRLERFHFISRSKELSDLTRMATALTSHGCPQLTHLVLRAPDIGRGASDVIISLSSRICCLELVATNFFGNFAMNYDHPSLNIRVRGVFVSPEAHVELDRVVRSHKKACAAARTLLLLRAHHSGIPQLSKTPTDLVRVIAQYVIAPPQQ